MSTNSLHLPPASDALEADNRRSSVPAADRHEHQSRVTRAYRRWCITLISIALTIDALMMATLPVRIDPRGSATAAWAIAALLIISSFSLKRRQPRIADPLGILALLWLGSVACGTMATVGLSIGMPIMDEVLFAVDRSFGIETTQVAAFLGDRSGPIISAMVGAYNLTMTLVGIGIMSLAVSGRRLEAWRSTFCYIGGLWTACLISIGLPAKGLGVWFSDELIARLPNGAARYAFEIFDTFHDSPRPLFHLHVLNGVVTFPSFHTVMGLIVLAMCRKQPLLFAAAAAWFFLMIASTLPLGGHYFVDLLGGFAVWTAWFATSRYIERQPIARLATVRR